jgi:hypothetical protein
VTIPKAYHDLGLIQILNMDVITDENGIYTAS